METKKQKILLVEDELYINNAYCDHLERAGFSVSTAYDGEEGLRMARVTKPDLILLDIIMPVMDGIAMLKELKADAILSTIPVIILTNLDKAESVEVAVAVGSTNYLVKSNYSLEELDAKVQQVLAAEENKNK